MSGQAIYFAKYDKQDEEIIQPLKNLTVYNEITTGRVNLTNTPPVNGNHATDKDYVLSLLIPVVLQVKLETKLITGNPGFDTTYALFNDTGLTGYTENTWAEIGTSTTYFTGGVNTNYRTTHNSGEFIFTASNGSITVNETGTFLFGVSVSLRNAGANPKLYSFAIGKNAVVPTEPMGTASDVIGNTSSINIAFTQVFPVTSGDVFKFYYNQINPTGAAVNDTYIFSMVITCNKLK